MIVNRSNLEAIFVNLKTTFSAAYDAAPTLWEQTAMKVPSSGSQNDYAWLARFPKMRKWLGDKTLRALAAHGYTVVNDDWECTVEVNRNDIEDDSLGIVAVMAKDAAYSAKQLPDELIGDLKNNGFAQLCYDGQYFYDSDHSVAGSSVSNLGTAALSAATTAAAAASYGAGRLAVMSYRDDEGRPLGLIPDTLEVPPALEATARLIVENPKLTDESPNPYMGTAKIIVNPWLTSLTAWYLHCTSRPLKPFIYQERKAPVFVQQTDMESDAVFLRKVYRYGAEARGAGGYGLWQMSYGSTGLA